MNSKPWSAEQLFMTYVAFEVFCLLMLDENFLVVEFTVAIPGRGGINNVTERQRPHFRSKLRLR